MKLEVDKSLLPIKIHFFFFFAALGPILPQINVFGRQLGVSAAVMGMVTAVLPLLWAAAKPMVGYVVDYWPNHRKLVFMLLIIIMSGSYCCLWFLPVPDESEKIVESIYNLNDTIYIKPHSTLDSLILDKYNCHWNCSTDYKFNVYLSNSTHVSTMYIDGAVTNTSCSVLHMQMETGGSEIACLPIQDCNLLCYEATLDARENIDGWIDESYSSFYTTLTFWGFVLMMSVGTVAFNVANCIGDAVCFDVLGPDGGSKYGSQRAWGTVGYGITALLGGWLIDLFSGTYKNFTPAFIIAIVATFVDLASCRMLTLPSLSSPTDSGKALKKILKIPKVAVFIIFAVVAGFFDSFIIYYMFWFLEELAEVTGSKSNIKLIEGTIVAGQSFIGEVLFFFFSGKILNRWGYGTTLTFCLFFYGVRMIAISLIQHPWHLVFVESIMQGPTYALCYSTIVGYAAHVAPEGYSATVQGIVAGMDDGVGFALGSLVGGQLYSRAGGRGSFRILAGIALFAAAVHALLFAWLTRNDSEQKRPKVTSQDEGEIMLALNNGIYQDTVVPVVKKNSLL
ncbi:uncharacterized protein LOC123718117 [Pieris brassicae]|uniref:uncharacterized protein LOC123718117 n=1 Tax=Pieris brassicae TaxID=7116 RepID=UPI001E660B45|nr:uncharacterized protein LOC123718117 [Pieris brassicae]